MKDMMNRLLPELYSTSDVTGDLDIFLSVVGMTLDEIREKVDHLPEMASPADCPPDFLPYLASLVGAVYDPEMSPTPQRRRTLESVERYRRYGTAKGLAGELTRLGWEGEVIETFRELLRLGYRSKLGKQKFPGKLCNHGIYGVTAALDTREFDDTVSRHQPAGTIVWTSKERNIP